MRVVVTRPEHEARQWVQRLRDAGFDAIALPLIGIGGAPDAAAVRSAWARIGEFAAVMFVSGNAVRAFFRLRGDADFPARAWAPGPGTRDALIEAGVAASSVDSPAADAAQFDSEALWAQVRGQVAAGGRVLVVRGGDDSGQGSGRDWLAQQLAAGGVAAETVVAYVRGAPAWSESQMQQARDCTEGAWLFSSSEGIAHLRQLLPGCDWHRARAVATHPRIAQAARDAGFGVVLQSRPDFEDIRAALESFA